MSVSITTEHGTFEGETLKEAAKQERKARRAAKKQATIDAGLRQIARYVAGSVGFDVMACLAENKHSYRNWDYYAADDRWGPTIDTDRAIYPESARRVTVTVDTENGKFTSYWYGAEIVGHVTNASGCTIVIFVKDHYNGQTNAFAPGVWQGQMAAVLLPGVTPEQFQVKEDQPQAAGEVLAIGVQPESTPAESEVVACQS